MGKNSSTIQNVVKNHEDLTLKQVFDVTAQLLNNQDEIHGLEKILWEKDSWTCLLLIGDETVLNLQSTKVYIFSDSVLCLGWIFQHPDSNEAWKKELQGSKPRKAAEIMTESMESRPNLSGTSSQDSQRCSSAVKSMIYCATLEKHQKFSQKELYSCQCSMTSPVTEKGNKEECLANVRVEAIHE